MCAQPDRVKARPGVLNTRDEKAHPPSPGAADSLPLNHAEAQETDLWLCDDLQIARLTVLYAARGDAVSAPRTYWRVTRLSAFIQKKFGPRYKRETRRFWGHGAKFRARRRKNRRSRSSSGLKTRRAREP